MKRIGNFLVYLAALTRPSLRLERSPERVLMPMILAVLTLMAVFACLIPLKLSAGARFEARAIEGQLVVHLAQGERELATFEAQIAQLISGIEQFEAIESVNVASGPEMAWTQGLLLGDVSAADQLFGGIVRLDLVEKPGADLDLQTLQLLASNFESANVDDFRRTKEANSVRTRQAILAGLCALIALLILVVCIVNLTIRLSLRMHQRTLRVLHHLGATDDFGASLFQATTFRRAILGVLIGAGASLAITLLLNLVLSAQGYVGASGFGAWQIVALVVLPTALLALCIFVARQTALAFLKQSY